MAVQQVLTLTQLSQDAAANESVVRILWKSTQTGGSYNLNERTANYYVQLGGGETLYSVTYRLHKGATDTILDTTVTVPHDESGRGSISVRTWMDTRISAGEVTLTQSLTLTDIPRASAVSAADGFIGGRATAVISARSTAYTHALSYAFGTLTGWVGEDGSLTDTQAVFSGRTVNMALPEAFYHQLPDAPAGSCTLTCTTYHGEAVIGRTQCSFTVTADPARCSPTVTAAVTEGNGAALALTGDPGVLVRGVSTAHCTVCAAPGTGAQITQLRVGTTAVEGDTLDIPQVYSGSFTAKVTDSRGYTGTYQVELPLIAYVQLSLNGTVTRTDPTSGNAVLKVTGGFYNGSFGAADNSLALTYCVDGGREITLRPTLADHTYSAAVALSDLSYTDSHTVRVTATDALSTVTRYLLLQPGIPVFDWGRDDFRFHVPVAAPSLTLGDRSVADTVIDQGYTEPWHWRRWSSGWAECRCATSYTVSGITTPWGGLYAADEASPLLEYPLYFWESPVEFVTACAAGALSLAGTQYLNSSTQTGQYSILTGAPVETEQIVCINYFVTGHWKAPEEGDAQ